MKTRVGLVAVGLVALALAAPLQGPLGTPPNLIEVTIFEYAEWAVLIAGTVGIAFVGWSLRDTYRDSVAVRVLGLNGPTLYLSGMRVWLESLRLIAVALLALFGALGVTSPNTTITPTAGLRQVLLAIISLTMIAHTILGIVVSRELARRLRPPVNPKRRSTDR